MTGVGKTVVSGSEIEDFTVEIIGVMQNSGSTGGDLILVRLSGEPIRRSGGVAQGMSGSPVFFNGKLAGAVAFGWSLSDPNICMLTPIGEMLKISETMRSDLEKIAQLKETAAARQRAEDAAEISKLTAEREKAEKEKKETESAPDQKTQTGPKQIKPNPQKEVDQQPDKKEPGDKTDKEKEVKPATETKTPEEPLTPKLTPLMARGFSVQGLDILREGLKEFDIVPYSVGEAPYGTANILLEPGSAVSVEVMRGDMSLGVLGTVTWVDGDEVLAFGHPFTKRGQVNYFLSNAWTFTTVSSINSAFKVGAPGKLLGSVLQDRGSGVAGKIGLYPAIMPMLITVSDFTRGLHKEATVQIVQDEMLSPVLAQSAVVSIADRVLDRKGEGTALVKFTIRAAGLPGDREIKRENMFYSSRNITEVLAGELASGLQMLTRNRFQTVNLTDVDIQVEVSDKRNTATIISAKPLAEKANPGDTIGIEVTLQPYREDKITKVVHFTIPKDQKEGPMPLMIRGGTSLVGLQSAVRQQQTAETAMLLRQDSTKTKTFADEIDEFNKKDRNHDIVVDLLMGAGEKKPAKSTKKASTVAAPTAEEQQLQEEQINEFVQGSKYKTNTPIYHIVTGETVTGVEVAHVNTADE